LWELVFTCKLSCGLHSHDLPLFVSVSLCCGWEHEHPIISHRFAFSMLGSFVEDRCFSFSFILALENIKGSIIF
jgi:hypothetical protein